MNTARRVDLLVGPGPSAGRPGPGLTTVVCLLNLPTPILVQGLVDRVVTPGRYALLPAYLVGLIAVFGLQAGVRFRSTPGWWGGWGRGSSASCGTGCTTGRSGSG